MKNLYIILLSTLAPTSCEEVIDLKLDTAPQKLVIDAALDWKKGEAKAYPIADISYTEPYFAEAHSPAANNAVMKITSDSQTYNLTLWDGTSTMTSDNLTPLKGGSRYVLPAGIAPQLGKNYELTIKFNGQTYTAKDKMLEIPTMAFNRIVQKENGGFLGNHKELCFYFEGISDGVANAYLVKLSQNNTTKTTYGVLDDNYIANDRSFFVMTGVDSDEKLKKDDAVNVLLCHIQPEYKNFLQTIIQQSERQSPFAILTRPIGNIVNITNKRENLLGAFRVSQYTTLQYAVKQQISQPTSR